MLLGDRLEDLSEKRVIVFGVGGVGSYTVEALVRSGIGSLVLVDRDTVSESNINRQLIALSSTVGKRKVDVARDRALDINPACRVETRFEFVTADTADSYLENVDYAVDAIDNVSAKIALAVSAAKKGIPYISCMGTGNKLDPSRLEITDLAKTHTCPLAKVMRVELRKRGIQHLKVLYSTEPPIRPLDLCEDKDGRRSVPGSVAFVPSVAGLMIAGQVVRDLAGITLS